MRIERAKHMDAWTVHVDTDELVCGNKTLPYPTTIGLVYANGKVAIWTPAAYKPRGYKDAARDMLEQAREELIASGELHAKPRPADYRTDLKVKAANRGYHRAYVRAYGSSR
jgi:hypothetical protein